MEFMSVKWLWLYAGAFLMLAEVLAPGFVIFFFGLAAATVGLVLFAADLSATVQVVLFSAFSVAYLVGLRRLMKALFMGATEESQAVESAFAGRLGCVVEAIRPGAPGRVLVGDAEWTAAAAESLEPGAAVRVVAQRNLTLTVEPAGSPQDAAR